MTDQGSAETPTTNVPTPPVAPPAEAPPPPPDQMPTYQQPAAYQQPAFAPPAAAYPPQAGSPPPTYQQPTQPGWAQPPAQGGPAWGQPQAPAGPAWGQPQQPPPGQPNWGQPQPPAGPAWGQPQQPPPGQPGWAQPQPQYWVQPAATADYGHGTSIWAVIAGIPLMIYGLIIVLIGAGLLIVRSFVDDVIRQGSLDASLAQSVRDAIAVVAVIILIIGILQVLAAIGIWAHKGWGRWLGIVWGVLGTLIGLAALGGSRTTTTINGDTTSSNLGGALFILVPYGFVLIAMIIGGGHFHRRRG